MIKTPKLNLKCMSFPPIFQIEIEARKPWLVFISSQWGVISKKIILNHMVSFEKEFVIPYHAFHGFTYILNLRGICPTHQTQSGSLCYFQRANCKNYWLLDLNLNVLTRFKHLFPSPSDPRWYFKWPWYNFWKQKPRT